MGNWLDRIRNRMEKTASKAVISSTLALLNKAAIGVQDLEKYFPQARQELESARDDIYFALRKIKEIL